MSSLKDWLAQILGRDKEINGSAPTAEQPSAAPLVFSPQELQKTYSQLSTEQQQAISAYIHEHLQAAERPAPNLTHRVIGRLVFEFEGTNGEPKPLHHMPLELWDVDPGYPDDLLAKGETDAEGHFEIWYDPRAAGFMDDPDLDLRIFEPSHIYHSDGTVEEKQHLVHVIPGADNVTNHTYDFGTCRVPYWEYDPDAVTPRVLILDQGNPPQTYEPGRSVAMVKAAARVEAIRRKHKLQYKLSPDSLTLTEVQNDFPLNVTRQLEETRPGYSRSDEYFGERILNGMIASVLDKDLEHPGRYRLVHQWNAYEQDGEHVSPNVDMRFEIIEEKLRPVEIRIGLRQPGQTAPNAPTEKHTLTPADGARWEQAKRIARSSASLSAELDAHLVATHLNIEQYAIAIHRNIRKNPLRWLLYPHLRDVTLVNYAANSFLIGETGHITRAVGLTAEALGERLGQSLGMHDWKNWRPRVALTPSHQYAQVANLYWRILTEYVDNFFETHLAEIQEHWLEVRRFSDDLVAHSVPLFLCSYLRRHARPGTAAMAQSPDWYSRDERADLHIGRVDVDGTPRAITPITQTDTPSQEDIDHMKQVCRYIIMHATLMHDWPNARQYEGGGEVVYMSLGLRYGDHGPFAPEDDLSVAPHPLIASEQLFISYMLSNGGYGYIIKNESRDIHPDFIKLLRKHAPDFAALGLDVNSIQSRINI